MECSLTVQRTEQESWKITGNAAKESQRQQKYSKKDNSIAARKAYSQHSSNIQPNDISNDVSQEHLMSLKQRFFDTKVKVDQEAADRIECDTKD